jgi:hypothetical protein
MGADACARARSGSICVAARFIFDLFNIVDALINEVLQGHALVVPTFHELNVEPVPIDKVKFDH